VKGGDENDQENVRSHNDRGYDADLVGGCCDDCLIHLRPFKKLGAMADRRIGRIRHIGHI